MVHIGNSWDQLLKEEFNKDYYLKLREILKREYQTATIYPPMVDIFNALKMTAFEDVKVVILGQDPYFNEGQAHGLSFSVRRGVRIPPSLRNIYKELHDDLGIPIPRHGELTSWAKQGVLLLNATLTVRQGEPNSHQKIGWSILTDRIIELLGKREKPLVFMLWGNFAIQKEKLIQGRHLILKSTHPSPLSASRGFLGSKPFSKANAFLEQYDSPVDWSIQEEA